VGDDAAEPADVLDGGGAKHAGSLRRKLRRDHRPHGRFGLRL
jgi:hypothetical protein